MEVVWTKNAKYDLKEYFEHSKLSTEQKVREYIFSLIEYVVTLEKMPQIGRRIFEISNVEIRQLVYEKHRILYTLARDKVYILAVVHTTRDYNTIIKYIKDNI